MQLHERAESNVKSAERSLMKTPLTWKFRGSRAGLNARTVKDKYIHGGKVMHSLQHMKQSWPFK